MTKKEDDEEMNAAVKKTGSQKSKKERIRESFNKAVKLNGKALEKLSKN